MAPIKIEHVSDVSACKLSELSQKVKPHPAGKDKNYGVKVKGIIK